MKARTCWRTLAVSAALALAWSAGAGAQSKGKPAVGGATPIRVDGTVIKGYIDYMASDDKEGRRSLTPGYEKTAEWAAAKFKEWGLKPAGDNGGFLQDVPVVGRGSGQPWTTGIPALSVDGRAFYINDSDFTLSPASTAGAAADADIVFVGYGISAPAKGLDEYAGVDVKGKIVLVFKGSPKDAPAARGMFGATVDAPKNNEAWADESKDAAKIKTAYDKGAAAILLFAPEKLAPPNPMAAPQALSQAQIMAMMAGAQAPAEPYTRPFLVMTDVSERVFRHVDVPRRAGVASRLHRAHGPVAPRHPRRQGALGGDRGQGPGERLQDDDLLQREAEEQRLAQRGRQGRRHRPEAQGAGHRRRRSPRSRRA